MGTNYYLRRILTKEDQMVLGYRVMNADKFFDKNKGPLGALDNIQAVVEELEQFLKPRHLGKLSAGREFCFRSNPDLYGDSLEDIYRYLSEMVSQKKAAIFSEYGEEVTPEQFRDKVLSHVGQQNFQRNNEPDDPWKVSFNSTREWLSSKDKTWWYNGEFC